MYATRELRLPMMLHRSNFSPPRGYPLESVLQGYITIP
jgi:hypothetical protein